jgi:hypothetical protein
MGCSHDQIETSRLFKPLPFTRCPQSPLHTNSAQQHRPSPDHLLAVAVALVNPVEAAVMVLVKEPLAGAV